MEEPVFHSCCFDLHIIIKLYFNYSAFCAERLAWGVGGGGGNSHLKQESKVRDGSAVTREIFIPVSVWPGEQALCFLP